MNLSQEKRTYSSDGDARCCFPASNTTETGLVLDDAVWDSHLAAQGRQEQNQLKEINKPMSKQFKRNGR